MVYNVKYNKNIFNRIIDFIILKQNILFIYTSYVKKYRNIEEKNRKK